VSREPIGVVESVRKVDDETVATVRLGVPSDADVETLRRAMVEAHQTWLALKGLSSVELDDEGYVITSAAWQAWVDAARAHVAAKRARGGDRP
jgi:hypothetical protein